MAKTMSVKELIKDFQMMYEQHWIYTANASETGNVDCSGAFVWSYNQHGMYIYHGSNRIAREYVVELIPIKEAKEKGLIVPGMAAFKIYNQGDTYYNLRPEYQKGGSHYNGDLTDYHHIGLVDTDTNYILNAKGKDYGFVRSKITEKWTHVAYLKNIIYEEEKPMEEKLATVVAQSGSTVNVRASANKNSVVLFKVPIGSTVTITNDLGEWCKIKYEGKTGYMMSNYLDYNCMGDDTSDDSPVNIDMEKLVKVYNDVFNAYIELGDILGMRG